MTDSNHPVNLLCPFNVRGLLLILAYEKESVKKERLMDVTIKGWSFETWCPSHGMTRSVFGP